MSKHSKPSRPRPANDANRIRIIGGTWRSRVIDFPDSAGLRPTANRVRETLFNWLGQTLHGRRCLDLFAGSGALGFEAASRGAERVVMVEKSKSVCQALRRSSDLLGATNCLLVEADADAFLEENSEKFDVVFLDPPFASNDMARLLRKLPACMADDALVYVEWGKPLAAILNGVVGAGCDELLVVKQGKAGVVHFGLLSLAKGAT